MSCPYFYPVAAMVRSGPQSAMLPLGDAWVGACRAVPGLPWEPDAATLHQLCNLGYARGVCPSFPPGDGPDAVRFAISRDDGAALLLYYVVERDHHPFAHGPIEYSLQSRELAAPPPGETLRRQACAYVDSYLRRRAEHRARV